MKYFTKQWYKNNQKLFRHKKGQKALQEYYEYYRQIEPRLPDSIKNMVDIDIMHDCIIVDNCFVGKDFHMKIDSRGCYRSVEKLVFINAEIVESDIDLAHATWLYDEVYIQQERYEMQILFWSKNCGKSNPGDLGEMTIRFDEVVIE